MIQSHTPSTRFFCAPHDGSKNGGSTSGKREVNRMWGGRFTGGAHPWMLALNSSIESDKRIAQQDIVGSQAHVTMLAACGIIPDYDATQIKEGLTQIAHEIADNKFVWDQSLEDVHMNIEARLVTLIGEAGKKLHTGRSRNDQVATDMRLWLKSRGCEAIIALARLVETALTLCTHHTTTVMPGMTHLQVAQPVTFAFHMMAHVESWLRDMSRWHDWLVRMDECPLGAAALAGTSFPINREQTSHLLGFSCPTANAMDSVSARDHMMEALSVCAISSVHLSRLAEELVIWSAPMVNFVSIDDAFCSGSSIMPQKRNPDAAELVRAKPAKMVGAFTAMTTLVKGLPLAYCKDLQDDKSLLFMALDDYVLAVDATTGMIDNLAINAPAMAHVVETAGAVATEVADWLVQEHHVAFRDAHHIVGKMVRFAQDKGIALAGLNHAQLCDIDPRLGQGVQAVLDPITAIERRNHIGGTSPQQVKKAIDAAKGSVEKYLVSAQCINNTIPTMGAVTPSPSPSR